MENPNAILWLKRQPGDYKPPAERYTENNQRFISLEMKHGGYFHRRSGMRFTCKEIDIFDFIDVGDLNHRFLERMMLSIGFRAKPFFYYQHPNEEFEYGMIKLETTADFARFQVTVWPRYWRATPVIYVEANTPTIFISYPKTLLEAGKEKMVQIISPCIKKKPHIQVEALQTILCKKYGVRFPLPMIKCVMDQVVLAVWGQKMESWGLGS